MKYLVRLLAWRYITKSTDSNTISTMTYICFLSMLIGAFALTLVSAIMNGFEYSMHAKMPVSYTHLTGNYTSTPCWGATSNSS